jgi:peptidylprolyl isomerase
VLRKILLFLFIATASFAEYNPVNGEKLGILNGTYIREDGVNYVLQKSDIKAEWSNLSDEQKDIVYEQYVKRQLVKENAYDILKRDKDFINQSNYLLKEYALQYWKQKKLDKIKVSDTQIKEYYDQNSDSFGTKERYKIRHILVKSEKLIDDIIYYLNKSKDIDKEFAIMAQRYSLDVDTKDNSGELGWYEIDSFDNEYQKKIQTLNSKEYTKIKIKDFYDLVYVEDKKTTPVTLQEAKDAIVQILKAEKYKEFYKSLANSLEKKMILKTYYK